MRRGIIALVVAAALSGCAGGNGAREEPTSRATFGTIDQEPDARARR